MNAPPRARMRERIAWAVRTHEHRRYHRDRLPNKKPAIRIAGFLVFGARSWTRTNDPLINSQVL